MQDTTNYKTMTPSSLAEHLRMDYAALKKAMSRIDIYCAIDDELSRQQLADIIQQQSQPHHKRPEETTKSAKELGIKLGIFHSDLQDGAGQPAPSATPKEAPKKIKQTPLPTQEHHPITPGQKTQHAKTDPIAALPAWRHVLFNAGRTIAVATLIAFQAFIFASLTMRVVNGQHSSIELQFWFAFVAAFLIESAGVMIVSRYKVPEGAGEWAKRDIEASINKWLIPFMAFQVMVDCSYIGLFYSWSDIIGQWLVALAIPVGIFTYSHLYFNRN